MTEQGKKKIKIKTTGNQLELTVDRGWYEPRRTIENERISSIQCPSCKSTDKKHIIKRNNNGIMGPGFRSWIVEEHFECNECGTMYKDIFKIKKHTHKFEFDGDQCDICGKTVAEILVKD